MPVDPLTLATFGSSVGSLIAGGMQNRKNISFQQKENELNRQHDMIMQGRQNFQNKQNWERENEYNSPQKQMERLIAANLDPNLVYGKGATAMGGSISGSSAPTTSGTAPQTDLSFIGKALTNFLDTRMQVIQTDNMKLQADLMKAEERLKNAQTIESLSHSDTNKFDLDFKKGVNDTLVRQLQLQNDMTQSGIDKNDVEMAHLRSGIDRNRVLNTVDIDRNEREKMLNTANIAKTTQEILESKLRMTKIPEEIAHIRAMVELSKDESVIKKIHKDMLGMGITPTDPAYARMFIEAIGNLVGYKKPDLKKVDGKNSIDNTDPQLKYKR